MAFEVGQTVYVSTYNRLRNAKPYCKPYIITEVSKRSIAAVPKHCENYPTLWLHFGSRNLSYFNHRSKFEYRIFKTVEAFNRAVLEGEFE